MAALLASRRSQMTKPGEWVITGVRPVTLLIASGIILIAAILIVTGLAAGHLREQALANTEGEIARLNLVIAEESNRSIASADALLLNLVQNLHNRGVATPLAFAQQMAGQDIHEWMRGKLGGIPQIAAVTLVGADGAPINSSREWPVSGSGGPWRDYAAIFQSQPELDLYIGTPMAEDAAGKTYPGGNQTNGPLLPIARRVTGAQGEFLGLVVAAMPVADIEALFRSVPLGDDGSISLVRRDGVLLARYPAQPGAIGRILSGALFGDAMANGSGGTVRQASTVDGEWKIKSIRALRNYPLAVVVTRRADKALAGWSHQAILFGAFAVIGAVVIGAMVLLIARQFRVYSALATIRAEKIEMERARIAAEAELLKKERLSVLGQLTATVAHELRNPLSAIRNTLFSIKEIAAGKGLKLDRPVARMERSIERCDRIIGDLLEYTKTRELRCTAVAFDNWLCDVLNDQHLAPGISLVRDLHAADAIVPIDADRIRRVVINLIDNAAQAITEQQALCVEKRITARTRVADAAVELVIEDSGPGIPPENLVRIFEPLFSTKSFGTGLGLATVKQIVTQHDGSIRIDSEPGRGTRVIVRLPLSQPAKAAA